MTRGYSESRYQSNNQQRRYCVPAVYRDGGRSAVQKNMDRRYATTAICRDRSLRELARPYVSRSHSPPVTA
ncbi:hypothetical protein CY34DRAFT_810914 [Suillus luteus UH-Slu-Lm8-n1]|uniref:Uncharacterized protein n=1 Tax=Suillus luteus UH-Slu-Lm8-n1 TaxID=930992 RepID=A0A0D0ARE2_9AGAM|nr:hypothetical protein CY34DRAFT_810914 [Suillus luteus UH-Slu-Lm8-n1]